MSHANDSSSVFFPYGRTETEHLSSRDPKLGAVIERFGHLKITIIPDLFTAIVFNIVSQQVSFRAAETVWKRVVLNCANDENSSILLPEDILAMDEYKLQGLGLSWRKTSYIREAALACIDGRINAAELMQLPDKQIRHELIKLPGIGNWTVDMLLMFSLKRKDILSKHDLAIRRGLMRLHHLEEFTDEDYEQYRRLYSPYGTVASFYLWEIAHESES